MQNKIIYLFSFELCRTWFKFVANFLNNPVKICKCMNFRAPVSYCVRMKMLMFQTYWTQCTVIIFIIITLRNVPVLYIYIYITRLDMFLILQNCYHFIWLLLLYYIFKYYSKMFNQKKWKFVLLIYSKIIRVRIQF